MFAVFSMMVHVYIFPCFIFIVRRLSSVDRHIIILMLLCCKSDSV